MALKTLSYLCVLSGSVVSDFLWSHEPSRQDYWSGLPLPTPGDLPDPGIKPTSLDLAYVTDNQNIANLERSVNKMSSTEEYSALSKLLYSTPGDGFSFHRKNLGP